MKKIVLILTLVVSMLVVSPASPSPAPLNDCQVSPVVSIDRFTADVAPVGRFVRSPMALAKIRPACGGGTLMSRWWTNDGNEYVAWHWDCVWRTAGGNYYHQHGC